MCVLWCGQGMRRLSECQVHMQAIAKIFKIMQQPASALQSVLAERSMRSRLHELCPTALSACWP